MPEPRRYPTASLNGRQLLSWMDRHGGLAAVHVRPFGAGWANTLVCRDGTGITTSAQQDAALISAMDEREAVHGPRIVQVRNPRTDRWVKIDREKGRILSHKNSPGPYKGVAIGGAVGDA